MNKKILFQGTATALITPFRSGEIDFPALKKIINSQIEAKIDALVVGGTSGEVSTLTFDEKLKLYSFTLNEVSGRVPVILGCGSNDTKSACALAKEISKLGADGLLSVTPYYNKGTNEGIKRHYLSIAESADLPIILYNVPQRTGVNLPIELIKELSLCEHIVGIKEASDSAERLLEVAALGDDMPLYSGNDTAVLEAMSLGGFGVVSVISNLLPKAMVALTGAFRAGELSYSRELQIDMLPMIKALFCEVNPVPIKYAMSLAGFSSPETRLPLSLPDSARAERIECEYKAFIKKYPKLCCHE